jgi:heme exporter protein B
MNFSEIKYLLQKDFTQELRQKHTIGGLFIYIISTVFVCFLSFRQIVDIPTWNALFWIILLFAAIQATGKSFQQDIKSRLFYLFGLTSPQSYILSKMILNGIIIFILAIINYAFYSLLIGNPVENQSMFLIGLIFGSFGLAINFTMVSGIASKTSNQTLTAILGFPIILPLLMSVIRFSKNAIDGIDWSVNYKYLVVIICLKVMVVALSYVLFPYLWRE